MGSVNQLVITWHTPRKNPTPSTHRRVLLVDERAEAGLALDDGVGDALLAAERGEPHHQLDGVHVVGDGHEAHLCVDVKIGWSLGWCVRVYISISTAVGGGV